MVATERLPSQGTVIRFFDHGGFRMIFPDRTDDHPKVSFSPGIGGEFLAELLRKETDEPTTHDVFQHFDPQDPNGLSYAQRKLQEYRDNSGKQHEGVTAEYFRDQALAEFIRFQELPRRDQTELRRLAKTQIGIDRRNVI